MKSWIQTKTAYQTILTMMTTMMEYLTGKTMTPTEMVIMTIMKNKIMTGKMRTVMAYRTMKMVTVCLII